jgi:hypothetical protein
VKLIDVYPHEVGREPQLGGYQLTISADILRGRYRDSFGDPKPIPAGKRSCSASPCRTPITYSCLVTG